MELEVIRPFQAIKRMRELSVFLFLTSQDAWQVEEEAYAPSEAQEKKDACPQQVNWWTVWCAPPEELVSWR